MIAYCSCVSVHTTALYHSKAIHEVIQIKISCLCKFFSTSSLFYPIFRSKDLT